ncbi:XAC2610-related protein [Brevibacillus sp. SYSU BS000544]|uniref:XAC2610-related protein n=1 Tax=Brevibacillus sp. SYSU BS000544 TaxID=3416443 RepID=UPI003CE4A7F9
MAQPVEPKEKSTAAPKERSSSVSPSPTASEEVDPIVFKEREVDDHTYEDISKLIRDYQHNLIKAIDTNTFSYVEPYLLPGSSLYNSQKELVENLYSRKVKESFVSTEIFGYYIDKNRFKVEVSETIEVFYPKRGPSINEYPWYYTVEKANGKYYLSTLEEWTSYKQDMDKRGGSVKVDGYYAEELLTNYHEELENAINTLDITEIKQLAANDLVLGKLKDLIIEFRRKGSEFTLNVSSLYEDMKTFTFVQELNYQYKDKNGNKQSGTKVLYLQLDEIRGSYQGYAVIRYLKDAKNDWNNAEPLSVVSYHLQKVHSNMPEYLFMVYGSADSPERWSNFSANKIEIYNAGKNGRLLQECTFEKTSTGNGNSLGVEFEDMNFDGYLDFRIQAETPAGPNIPYLYWLWDQQTSKYVSNTTLEQITSPEFDSYNKTIHSFVKEDPTFYSDNLYQYRDDTPILIKRIERAADIEKKLWNITIKELRNNQMKVTGRYKDTLVIE